MTAQEIKDEFNDRNLRSLWQRVRFWFFVRKLYWVKRIALWEGYLDRIYFETKYSDELAYNDSADRQALQDENRRPFKEQDRVRIASLEEKISRAKAIKESYRNNKNFIVDQEKYLETLDIWLHAKDQA